MVKRPLMVRYTLGKFSIPAGHNKIQQEEEDLVRRNNGGVGEVILCKDGHCSGTKRRFSGVTKDSHHWLPKVQVHLATRNSTEFQAKQQWGKQT
ncbi:hypothetical protein RJ639_045204 [Escallonia herrerae]|uniref:Uncharacterized protein n=1 Tax=Escallonia herrerae TaxID=1293975 RepID=A0AA88W978_9ASTE|nr:hypothetical protein RJ639_045204 [Escallonia herrerae]